MTAEPKKRDLLEISSLQDQDIQTIFKAAKIFSESPDQTFDLLKGITLVNAFFENSTRTRMSFELAARRVSAQILSFQSTGSSVKKGESFLDTIRNIEALKPQAIVVRHASAGSPHFLAKRIRIPVINAGDGFHEHPTQALLDAFTIQQQRGPIAGKNILIIGDIAHSRVARSNIALLKRLGAKVFVSGPPTLLPPHPEVLGVQASILPDGFLPKADVVMMLRIQHERHEGTQVPNLSEYAYYWGMNEKRAGLLKKDAIIMHPGPINQGVEIDNAVADGPLSVVLDQVANGVFVRMAVLAWVCRPENLERVVAK